MLLYVCKKIIHRILNFFDVYVSYLFKERFLWGVNAFAPAKNAVAVNLTLDSKETFVWEQ